MIPSFQFFKIHDYSSYFIFHVLSSIDHSLGSQTHLSRFFHPERSWKPSQIYQNPYSYWIVKKRVLSNGKNIKFACISPSLLLIYYSNRIQNKMIISSIYKGVHNVFLCFHSFKSLIEFKGDRDDQSDARIRSFIEWVVVFVLHWCRCLFGWKGDFVFPHSLSNSSCIESTSK